MDIEEIRRNFPILDSGIIYFDSAASSLTPGTVLDKMLEYYTQYRSNVGRSVHRFSEKAKEEYEGTRDIISRFINSRSQQEIIFTKNATEGINLVASGLRWKRGDKIVTTLVEHHSNFVPWLRLQKRYGVKVEVVNPKDPMKEGVFLSDDFKKHVDDKTKLVAVTHASNVLGTILPVKEISDIAHDHGSLFLVDGAQSTPHMSVDVQKIGCEFFTFSGHKMCGPTGSGCLYIKNEVLEDIEPLCVGGGTVSDVGPDYYLLADGSERFEAGTPPIGETIGLGHAVKWLNKLGMDNIKKHEYKLNEEIFEELSNISNLEIYGPEPSKKIGITSFNIDNVNSHDIAFILDSVGILIRSGHHCAIPLTKKVIKKAGSLRISTYMYNTRKEVEKLIKEIKKIAKRKNKT